jgi:methionyl-tRNA formyltransferase
MRIIFYGTPEFAVASLDALNSEFEIAAVVTVPDKPAGRGLELRQSAVKKYAIEHGLKLLQPESLRSDEFLNEIRTIGPDLQVVVAFRMMPKVLWSLPPKGTINLHASLLPQYRGAAPINWAIINGETHTGLTTFFINETIDTGNIILQEIAEIGSDTTAGELHDHMKSAGASLLVKTVQSISSGNLKETAQSSLMTDTVDLKSAPKLDPSNCRINWKCNAADVHNLIRGLSPYPGSFTSLDLNGIKKVKIFSSHTTSDACHEVPGTLVRNGNQLLVACADEYLRIGHLQIEGKRRMAAQEFLNGLQTVDDLLFT